jgi:hypothetical protein
MKYSFSKDFETKVQASGTGRQAPGLGGFTRDQTISKSSAESMPHNLKQTSSDMLRPGRVMVTTLVKAAFCTIWSLSILDAQDARASEAVAAAACRPVCCLTQASCLSQEACAGGVFSQRLCSIDLQSLLLPAHTQPLPIVIYDEKESEIAILLAQFHREWNHPIEQLLEAAAAVAVANNQSWSTV